MREGRTIAATSSSVRALSTCARRPRARSRWPPATRTAAHAGRATTRTVARRPPSCARRCTLARCASMSATRRATRRARRCGLHCSVAATDSSTRRTAAAPARRSRPAAKPSSTNGIGRARPACPTASARRRERVESRDDFRRQRLEIPHRRRAGAGFRPQLRQRLALAVHAAVDPAVQEAADEAARRDQGHADEGDRRIERAELEPRMQHDQQRAGDSHRHVHDEEAARVAPDPERAHALAQRIREQQQHRDAAGDAEPVAQVRSRLPPSGRRARQGRHEQQSDDHEHQAVAAARPRRRTGCPARGRRRRIHDSHHRRGSRRKRAGGIRALMASRARTPGTAPTRAGSG